MCLNRQFSVEGLLHEKERLEGDLLARIEHAVSLFTARTGLSVRDIQVRFVDVTDMSSDRQVLRLESVHVTTNL